LDGIDFMFDPRSIKTAIPSWRVATRQRHFDLTSPLRLARKLSTPGADVSLGEGRFEGRIHEVLTLREVGRPPVRLFLDEATGLPLKLETTERILRSATPSWRCSFATIEPPAGSLSPRS